MSYQPNLVSDDEDDTLLFKRWEDHVIKNHPNPERLGCPSRETLKTFVDRPRKVGLSELHGDHITRCRECVWDLIELRRLRAERLERASVSSWLRAWWGWRSGVTIVFLCVLFIAAAVWRHYAAAPRRVSQGDQIAIMTLDLSGDGVSRGTEATAVANPMALPRRLVDLHLILPVYSPAGAYRIAIAEGRNTRPLQIETATAVANGPRTELHLRMDLRGLHRGSYLLGTTHDGESIYFYPITIK